MTNDVDNASTEEQWIGQQLPDLTLTDVDGNTIELSTLRGRPTLLHLWDPWWTQSRDVTCHMIKLRDSIPQEKLAVIALSDTEPDPLRRIGRQLGINYVLVSTDDQPTPFDDLYSLPITFFVDPNGTVQSVLESYHDFEQLTEHLESL